MMSRSGRNHSIEEAEAREAEVSQNITLAEVKETVGDSVFGLADGVVAPFKRRNKMLYSNYRGTHYLAPLGTSTLGCWRGEFSL